jgi:DNA (cytosine-5)-methyltransferase 1
MPAGGTPAVAGDADGQPMQTVMASDRLSLVLSNMKNNVPRSAGDEPMHVVTTGSKLYLVEPMIVETRGKVDRPGGGNDARDAGSEPIGTVSAQGNHHFLVANYGSPDGPPSKGGYVKPLFEDPLGTVTARDKHALFTYRAGPGVSGLDEPLGTVATRETHALLGVSDDEVNACSFRMLRAHELKIGSGFPESYVLHGNHEDQVAQVGNAVNPPPGYRLVRACMESLDEASGS